MHEGGFKSCLEHHCHYPAGKMMNVECPLPTQTSLTCPTTTRTHPATNTVEMSTDAATVGSLGGDMVGGAQSAESCDSCPSLAALGGGLGRLCVVLALLLVGVVIWSYHRQMRLQER